MDHTERMALHEQYKSPLVGVGELVLFKRRKEAFWSIGFVMPPAIHGWKPGDAFNPKRLRIYVPITPFGKQPVEEDCVHVNDPYYTSDPHSIVSAWEKVSTESMSAANLMQLINAASDRLLKIESDLEHIRQLASNQTAEISKLGASISMAKTEKPSSRRRQEEPQETAA